MTPQERIELDKALRERFEEATRSMQFNTIDEIVAQLDAHGFFDEAIKSRALDTYKKIVTRQMLRTLTKDGVKTFRSIQTPDEAGNLVRKYKQEALFNLDDYRQTIGYHVGQARHHVVEAEGLRNRAADRYNVTIQFELDFALIKAA